MSTYVLTVWWCNRFELRPTVGLRNNGELEGLGRRDGRRRVVADGLDARRRRGRARESPAVHSSCFHRHFHRRNLRDRYGHFQVTSRILSYHNL